MTINIAREKLASGGRVFYFTRGRGAGRHLIKGQIVELYTDPTPTDPDRFAVKVKADANGATKIVSGDRVFAVADGAPDPAGVTAADLFYTTVAPRDMEEMFKEFCEPSASFSPGANRAKTERPAPDFPLINPFREFKFDYLTPPIQPGFSYKFADAIADKTATRLADLLFNELRRAKS